MLPHSRCSGCYVHEHALGPDVIQSAIRLSNRAFRVAGVPRKHLRDHQLRERLSLFQPYVRRRVHWKVVRAPRLSKLILRHTALEPVLAC